MSEESGNTNQETRTAEAKPVNRPAPKPGPRFDMMILGVALLAIGGILLATTLNPQVDFSNLFLDYWPLIIVAAGLVKILQSFTGQTQHGVLGTFFFLFIVMALASGAMWKMADFGFFWRGWEGELIHTDRQYFEKDEISLITIEANKADVTLRATTKDKIEIVTEVRSNPRVEDEWQDSYLGRLVEIGNYDGTLKVNADSTDVKLNSRSVHVDIIVYTPKDVDITVDVYQGDASLRDFGSRLIAKVERGDLYISDVSGPVEASVFSGDLTIRSSDGPTIVSGDRADVELYGIYNELTVNGERMDVEFANKYRLAGNTNIEIKHGYIEVDLDEESSFAFEGIANNGRVSVDFGREDDSKGGNYRFRSGDGEFRLILLTERGNISLDD
jgi:hypothetical protein